MEMKNIYTEQGLKGVINASGRMTKLGVSTISDEVAEVLVDAAQNYVVIDDLLEWAGKKVGKYVGCADACITSSASAGIALSVASLICKDNIQKVEHFFDTVRKDNKRQVILLTGHNIHYGAPVSTMLELGGAEIVEVGYSNRSTLGDIRNAVNENTLAIVFVKSHHCVQKNMVGIEEIIKLSNELGIPCIVDASAEEDLSGYIGMGADFVCYSGAKAIAGPTSGFVACSTEEYASNMRLQYSGIGRAMKVGKENIMGLVKAVEIYQTRPHSGIIGTEELKEFMGLVNSIEGLRCSIIQDEAGRQIYRAKVDFDESKFGMNAKQAVKALSSRNPSIYTRDHQANIGSLAIDPRPLNSMYELIEIVNALKQLKEK